MYIWNLNMQSYYNTIGDLAACGVSNGSSGKYGEDWISGDYATARASM